MKLSYDFQRIKRNKVTLSMILLFFFILGFSGKLNAQYIHVSGPTLVCVSSSGQFTADCQCTVTWTCSSNLTLISGQGTPTATFSGNSNGSGWVIASAFINGSETSSNPYYVWVGPPVLYSINCETEEPGTAGSSSSFSLWSEYSTISLPQYYVDASPATVWYNYQAYTMIYFPYPDTYYISVEVYNTCGSNYGGRYFTVE